MKGERHKIEEGTVIIISKLKENEEQGCWRCLVPMITRQLDKNVGYEYVWLKINGKCDYKNGDKAIVTRVISYHSAISRMYDGSKMVFRTIEVELKHHEKEVDEDEERDN